MVIGNPGKDAKNSASGCEKASAPSKQSVADPKATSKSASAATDPRPKRPDQPLRRSNRLKAKESSSFKGGKGAVKAEPTKAEKIWAENGSNIGPLEPFLFREIHNKLFSWKVSLKAFIVAVEYYSGNYTSSNLCISTSSSPASPSIREGR